MSVPRRVSALLDLAAADAAAALLLARASNRYAAYHCQQAIEKLVKALLLHEHHLDVLIGKLADQDPWKAKLQPFQRYSPFATSWRYPTPGGQLPVVPDAAAVAADAGRIELLIQDAKTALTSA